MNRHRFHLVRLVLASLVTVIIMGTPSPLQQVDLLFAFMIGIVWQASERSYAQRLIDLTAPYRV